MSLYERIGQYRATFYGGGGSEGIYQSTFFCFFHTNLSWDFQLAQNPKNLRFLNKFPCFCWEKFSGGFGWPPHKFNAPVTRTMTLKSRSTASSRLAAYALWCSKNRLWHYMSTPPISSSTLKNHWIDKANPWSRCYKRNSLSNEGIFMILPPQYFTQWIKRYVWDHFPPWKDMTIKYLVYFTREIPSKSTSTEFSLLKWTRTHLLIHPGKYCGGKIIHSMMF